MIVPAHFVRANTVLTASSLVPEIRLHLATQILPLWSKTEDEIEEKFVDLLGGLVWNRLGLHPLGQIFRGDNYVFVAFLRHL